MAGFLRGGGADRSAYGAPSGGGAPAGRSAYGASGGAGYASSGGGAGYSSGGGGGAGYGGGGGAGYSDAPRSARVPVPSSGYPSEKAQPRAGGGGGHLIVKCPDALVLSNCIVVNPQEWGQTQYVLVEGRYVFTAL